MLDERGYIDVAWAIRQSRDSETLCFCGPLHLAVFALGKWFPEAREAAEEYVRAYKAQENVDEALDSLEEFWLAYKDKPVTKSRKVKPRKKKKVGFAL